MFFGDRPHLVPLPFCQNCLELTFPKMLDTNGFRHKIAPDTKSKKAVATKQYHTTPLQQLMLLPSHGGL